MSHGTLQVLLVSAKGLKAKDLISKMDPYAIITYRTEEKKSGIASGSHPEWNESFLFSITNDQTQLKIKLMDKDTFTSDDFLGEATIPLEAVFGGEHNIPPKEYNIVRGDKHRGEIKVGLTYTPFRG